MHLHPLLEKEHVVGFRNRCPSLMSNVDENIGLDVLYRSGLISKNAKVKDAMRGGQGKRIGPRLDHVSRQHRKLCLSSEEVPPENTSGSGVRATAKGRAAPRVDTYPMVTRKGEKEANAGREGKPSQ
jgi:hypothetical protein